MRVTPVDGSNMDLTRQQALDYVRRWKLIRARELAELRAMSPSEKLRQLESLLATSRALGWAQVTREGEEAVWRTWQRLREKHRDRQNIDDAIP